jgi:hypothetical protein
MRLFFFLLFLAGAAQAQQSTMQTRPRIHFPSYDQYSRGYGEGQLMGAVQTRLAVVTTPFEGEGSADFNVLVVSRGAGTGIDYTILLLDACNQPQGRWCYTSMVAGQCRGNVDDCANSVTNWMLQSIRSRQQLG